MVSRALVLGSGAYTGFCWQWGVLASLHAAGIDLVEADLMVGTSGGSSAAVHLSGGADPQVVLATVQADRPRERDAVPAADGFAELLAHAIGEHSEAREILAAIGALALDAGGASESKLRQTVTGYLLVHEWPRRRLLIPAVDAATGELAVFSRDSEVSVVDAVAATCAMPGLWAPFTVGDRRYIDGSMRSSTNADLAAGHDRVLVVAPVNGVRGVPGASIGESLEPVRALGEVFLIRPDQAAKAAIGTDVFDMSGWAAAANAGVAQGESLAASVREFWSVQ